MKFFFAMMIFRGGILVTFFVESTLKTYSRVSNNWKGSLSLIFFHVLVLLIGGCENKENKKHTENLSIINV